MTELRLYFWTTGTNASIDSRSDVTVPQKRVPKRVRVEQCQDVYGGSPEFQRGLSRNQLYPNRGTKSWFVGGQKTAPVDVERSDLFRGGFVMSYETFFSRKGARNCCASHGTSPGPACIPSPGDESFFFLCVKWKPFNLCNNILTWQMSKEEISYATSTFQSTFTVSRRVNVVLIKQVTFINYVNRFFQILQYNKAVLLETHIGTFADLCRPREVTTIKQTGSTIVRRCHCN